MNNYNKVMIGGNKVERQRHQIRLDLCGICCIRELSNVVLCIIHCGCFVSIVQT